MLGVKVLAVEPKEAAARARTEGMDIALALAQERWFERALEPEVIRPPGDPDTVFLRYRNRSLLRESAWRFAGAWLPAAALGVALAVGVGEALALWGQRLFPAGHCVGCGYRVADLPGAVCPECGRAADPIPLS
jgi:Zn ribbon nucleic-acid-binding protein